MTLYHSITNVQQMVKIFVLLRICNTLSRYVYNKRFISFHQDDFNYSACTPLTIVSSVFINNIELELKFQFFVYILKLCPVFSIFTLIIFLPVNIRKSCYQMFSNPFYWTLSMYIVEILKLFIYFFQNSTKDWHIINSRATRNFFFQNSL